MSRRGFNLEPFPDTLLSNEKLRELCFIHAMSLRPQIAFTGTARQCIQQHDGHTTREWLDLQKLGKNVFIFNKQVTRRLCGRGAVRKGQNLAFAATIEGYEERPTIGGERLHVHMVISGLPPGLCRSRIESTISNEWAKSRWGYDQCRVEWLETDEDRQRWCGYILKKLTKEETDRFQTNIQFAK